MGTCWQVEVLGVCPSDELVQRVITFDSRRWVRADGKVLRSDHAGSEKVFEMGLRCGIRLPPSPGGGGCKPSGHESDYGRLDHRFGRVREAFVVGI